MTVARSTASHASVVFLKVHDFAQQVIAEQARLEARLREIVEKALSALREDQRIVLDAPGGLAVVVLANPEGALRFAWRASAERDLDFSVGISHGPVRIAPGPLHVVYGDALLTAEAVARSTEGGNVSAAREFRDAIGRANPGMRRLFARIGSAVDAHDRAHEMFRADQASVDSRRRTFYAIAGTMAAIVLAIGIGIRSNRPPPPPPPPAPEPTPGAVTFDIKPEGEVFIDGTLKGMSPPLKRIQLPPGKHVVEIRSGTMKPMTVDLAIGPGEEFAVQHTFVAPPPPPPPKAVTKPAAKPKPRPQQGQKQQSQPHSEAEAEKSFWDRLKDWFNGR
jgi:hypothetical protein